MDERNGGKDSRCVAGEVAARKESRLGVMRGL